MRPRLLALGACDLLFWDGRHEEFRVLFAISTAGAARLEGGGLPNPLISYPASKAFQRSASSTHRSTPVSSTRKCAEGQGATPVREATASLKERKHH
jgi:hypothetical protein